MSNHGSEVQTDLFLASDSYRCPPHTRRCISWISQGPVPRYNRCEVSCGAPLPPVFKVHVLPHPNLASLESSLSWLIVAWSLVPKETSALCAFSTPLLKVIFSFLPFHYRKIFGMIVRLMYYVKQNNYTESLRFLVRWQLHVDASTVCWVPRQNINTKSRKLHSEIGEIVLRRYGIT